MSSYTHLIRQLERQSEAMSKQVHAKKTDWDGVATALLFVVLAGAAVLAWFLSLLFPMGANSCAEEPNCSQPPILLAMGLTWTGIAAGVAVGIIGACVAAKRGTDRYVWPLSGTGVTIFAAIVGLALASSPMS